MPIGRIDYSHLRMLTPLKKEDEMAFTQLEIDARGFSCPIPVVKTTQAIDGNPGKPIIVLVDSAVARENVSRLAQSRGYLVKVAPALDGYRLQLIKS